MRNNTENTRKPLCKLDMSLIASPRTTCTVLLLCLRKDVSKIKDIQRSKHAQQHGNLPQMKREKRRKD